MDGIGNGLAVLGKLFIALFIVAILLVGYFAYDIVTDILSDKIIESEVIIKPTYKITSDGKTSDTIYIYTFKR